MQETCVYCPESNKVDDVNKASETVCASSESAPLPVTDSSTDTLCPSEVESIVNTVCHLRNNKYKFFIT